MVGQGYKVPDALRASGDITDVVAHAEIILMVIPTPFVEKTMAGIKDKLRPEQVSCRFVEEHLAEWSLHYPSLAANCCLLLSCVSLNVSDFQDRSCNTVQVLESSLARGCGNLVLVLILLAACRSLCRAQRAS